MVFYGSQTGTAEEFAGRLAKDAARYGMKGMVADPEECEMVSRCFSQGQKMLIGKPGVKLYTPAIRGDDYLELFCNAILGRT